MIPGFKKKTTVNLQLFQTDQDALITPFRSKQHEASATLTTVDFLSGNWMFGLTVSTIWDRWTAGWFRSRIWTCGRQTCRAQMKRDQRVLDLLISDHQLDNQQREGGFMNLNQSSYFVIYSICRWNQWVKNVLWFSLFGDFSTRLLRLSTHLSAFNRETTSNFRFPNNDTHTDGHTGTHFDVCLNVGQVNSLLF